MEQVAAVPHLRDRWFFIGKNKSTRHKSGGVATN